MQLFAIEAMAASVYGPTACPVVAAPMACPAAEAVMLAAAGQNAA